MSKEAQVRAIAAATVAASEERTMALLDQLRQDWRDDFGDLRDELRSEYMPAGRINERWVADGQHFDRLDAQVTSLQRDASVLGKTLPTLATVDQVRQIIREELAQHPTALAVERIVDARVTERTGDKITAAQVEAMLADQHKQRSQDVQRIITWGLGILVALQMLGIVNFARLLGH